MKNLLNMMLVISAIVLISSCASNDTANSDAVKQSEIYQSYTIEYNSGEKELTATASFRFGGSTGTTLLLSKPSSVTFGGEEMPSDNNIFSGTFYQLNQQTDFKRNYTFVFTDTDKKTYTNKVSINAVVISDCPTLAKKEDGFTVKWDKPLIDNETMDLIISDNKNNTASVSTSVVGSDYASFSASDLLKIEPGAVSVHLLRKTDSALKEATHLGGNIYTRYISQNVGLTLTGEPVQESAQK